ncbi:hypothetical protein RDI58_025665 [Solanum bulbocastanum]|uniref:Uncharacterized protein n=1 Tax=Solanum bulbocastanum TaxID=147425 RepID=A0AAN8Y4K4_SOLBU
MLLLYQMLSVIAFVAFQAFILIC